MIIEHRFELVRIDGSLRASCACGWRHGAPARDADHARDLWEHHGDPGKARARGRLRYAIREGWLIG